MLTRLLAVSLGPRDSFPASISPDSEALPSGWSSSYSGGVAVSIRQQAERWRASLAQFFCFVGRSVFCGLLTVPTNDKKTCGGKQNETDSP